MSSTFRFSRIAACFAAAVLLCGCGDAQFPSLTRDCAVPQGTVPFTFESGGNELSGFIDVPDFPGRHPAVLLIHDNGPTDVTRGAGDFAELRDTFREAGIASVVWDKAGSGCSTGRYRGLADMYLRADEVLDAIDALRMRPGIDPERIGLWASGQGGWIAPMAAVRSDEVSFLIVVGGPAGDPIDRRLHQIRRNLELEGYPEDEVRSLVATLQTALNNMSEQAPYEQYMRIVEPLRDHPFSETLLDLAGDIFPTERRYDELKSSAALDVSADVFLPAIEVPVLAMWGELDSKVDWRKSRRVYMESFAGRGEEQLLTSRVFDGANHELCEARTGSLDESRSSGDCRLVDGYAETMVAWLRSHDFTPGQPTQSSTSRQRPPSLDDPPR